MAAIAEVSCSLGVVVAMVGHMARMPLPRRPQVGFPTRADAIEQAADDVFAEEG